MKRLNSKKGISLIVLVITIIVMIILAAAIILALSSSGIIDRANEAKTGTNESTYNEFVSVKRAEWLLMDEATQEKNGRDFISYAENEAKEAGMDTKKYIIDENGTVEKCFAMIGDKKFLSLEEAVDSIESNEQVTIVIMNDMLLDYTIIIKTGRNIEIDLNGYSISVFGCYSSVILNNGNLKLVDTSDRQTGKIEAVLDEEMHENYDATFDYDDDGYITYEDSQTILKYIVGSITPDESLVSRFDADKNGVIDADDGLLLQSQYVCVTSGVKNNNARATLTIDETMEGKILGKPAIVYYK